MAHDKKYNLTCFYNDNKSNLYYIGSKRGKNVKRIIPFKEFKIVIKTYFEIKFEELFYFGDKIDINMPLISGVFQLRKCMQTRGFHALKDNVESKKQGRIVKYKIPVLDDWYSVLIWAKRNTSFKKLKVIFSKIPNDKKKEFVKEKGYDNIITKVIPTI